MNARIPHLSLLGGQTTSAGLLRAKALAAPYPAPRFPNVFCSQCGSDFGPGDNGFSHCGNHRHLTPRSTVHSGPPTEAAVAKPAPQTSPDVADRIAEIKRQMLGHHPYRFCGSARWHEADVAERITQYDRLTDKLYAMIRDCCRDKPFFTDEELGKSFKLLVGYAVQDQAEADCKEAAEKDAENEEWSDGL